MTTPRARTRPLPGQEAEFCAHLAYCRPRLEGYVRYAVLGLGITDWENVLGEALLWCWYRAADTPADEADFVRWVVATARLIAQRALSRTLPAVSTDAETITRLLDHLAPAPYAPRYRLPAELYADRVAAMVATLGGGARVRLPRGCAQAVTQLELAVAQDMVSVDAACATAALALVSARPWRVLGHDADTRARLQRVARALWTHRGTERYGLALVLARTLRMTRRQATRDLARVYDLLAQLTRPDAQAQRAG